MLLGPQLMARLQRDAPRVSLTVVPPRSDLANALATGKVDLAVVPVLAGGATLGPEVGGELLRRTLFHDSFRCFVRCGHPAINARGRLTARKYASLAHVLVSPTGEGEGFIDAFLKERALTRHVGFRTPDFATAMAVVAGSDLVMVGPRALERTPLGARVVSLAPPLRLPKHAVTLTWHRRFSAEPAHRWLRDILARTAKE